MSDLMMTSCQEGISMDDGNGVTHKGISVIASRHHHCIDININNIDTMRAIIAMAVINLGRRQRHPGDIAIS